MRGEVLFDAFTRGRYSTDASIYQIEPLGVALPRDADDVVAAIALARRDGFPIIARGGGSSQNGQPLGEAVVMDTSRHMNRVLEVDAVAGTATVQPGIVLDELNRQLRPTGWHFPVDVSTSAHATLGGMTGNNSAGTRSIKYGLMVHNVLGVEAVLADATRVALGELAPGGERGEGGALARPRLAELTDTLRALYAANADEIALRTPKVLRKVGGYNLDALAGPRPNLARLMVGSEGTLGFFTRIKLQLARIPRHRVGAVCHFGRFFDAMDMTRFLVELEPTAVELVDRKMMELARRLPVFRATLERHVRGAPDAILLVEFAGDDRAPLIEALGRLEQLLADHGYPGSVVRLVDAAAQAEMTAVRKAGLNIMMSMKGDGKPISFIEDCAVPLPHLAEFTDRLTRLFTRHGTEGTWYAHASVGCLHVRPILNMKDSVRRPDDAGDRRGGVRDRQGVQGLALRRARRRPEPLRVPRRDVRRPHGAGVRGGQGRVRSARPAQPGQDRAGAADGRPPAVSLQARLRRAPDLAGARLVGVGRPARGDRDVQQQRQLPQVRRGDVPELPGDRRRARRDPRPGQQPAAGAERPARPRRAGLRRHEARPWRCASAARRAGASARPASTWRA